jgi:hypothetical protein
MLASFPSGLVIYWAWNNVLSLIQQYYIMRKNNTEVHLWKNLGIDKWKTRVAAARSVDVGKLKGQIVSSVSSRLPRPRPAGDGKSGKDGGAAGGKPAEARATGMTREQALDALGLEPDASEKEIDAALADEARKRRQAGLNGSDHAIAARLDAAREILRGKPGS